MHSHKRFKKSQPVKRAVDNTEEVVLVADRDAQIKLEPEISSKEFLSQSSLPVTEESEEVKRKQPNKKENEPTPEQLFARQQLVAAARAGSLDRVKQMVTEKGADVNAEICHWTALQYGAFYGKVDMVKFLLEHGADPNKQPSGGSSPLMCAVDRGHKGVVEVLLQQPGIIIDQPDTQGYTPLLKAIKNGFEEIVQLLLETEPSANVSYCPPPKPANLAPQMAYCSNTPLQEAVLRGSASIVEQLLNLVSDVNFVFNNHTALTRACSRDNPAIVANLLDNNADINQPEPALERSPLHVAIFYKSNKVVALLIQRGASLHAVDKCNWTPLELAKNKSNTEAVKLIEAALAREGEKDAIGDGYSLMQVSPVGLSFAN